jgi:hypothetical protein
MSCPRHPAMSTIFGTERSRLVLRLASDRALDDVERILRECLGKQFALMPEASERTWLERARHAERSRWFLRQRRNPSPGFNVARQAEQMEGMAQDDNNDIVLTRSLKVYYSIY